MRALVRKRTAAPVPRSRRCHAKRLATRAATSSAPQATAANGETCGWTCATPWTAPIATRARKYATAVHAARRSANRRRGDDEYTATSRDTAAVTAATPLRGGPPGGAPGGSRG